MRLSEEEDPTSATCAATSATCAATDATSSTAPVIWHPATPRALAATSQAVGWSACCSTPQHTATHFNTPQHTATTPQALAATRLAVGWSACCNTLQHTATHYNAIQRTATHCNHTSRTCCHHTGSRLVDVLQQTATHCNVRQRTAIHCNTLQHTATHCNTLQHTATHCNTLQHTTTHCNTLQQHLWRDSFTTVHMWHVSFTYPRLHMWYDVSMWHDSFVWHDTSMWHDSFMWHDACDMTLSTSAHHMRHDFLRSLFSKEPYERDYILQKSPETLRQDSCDMTLSTSAHETWFFKASFFKRALRKRLYSAKEPCNFATGLMWHDPIHFCTCDMIFLRHDSCTRQFVYGVATISRLPQNIGLFFKRALRKRLYSAKETYNCATRLLHSSIYVWGGYD